MEVSLINREAIKLDIVLENKAEVLKDIAHQAVIIGAGNNEEKILNALWERENMMPTAVGKGIAIPHCKDNSINESKVLFYRLNNAIRWDEEEEVNLIFVILTNGEKNNTHLELISKLSRNILREEFLKLVNESKDSNNIYNKIKSILKGE